MFYFLLHSLYAIVYIIFYGLYFVQAGGTAVAEGDAAPAAENPPQSSWQTIKGFLVRMVIMYMIMSFFRRGTPPATPTTEVEEGGVAKPAPASFPSLNLYSETSKFVSVPHELAWLVYIFPCLLTLTLTYTGVLLHVCYYCLCACQLNIKIVME